MAHTTSTSTRDNGSAAQNRGNRGPCGPASQAARRLAVLVAMALLGALAPWGAAPASAITNPAPQVVPDTGLLAVRCLSVHTCVAVGSTDTNPDPEVYEPVGSIVAIVDGVPGSPSLVPGASAFYGVDCATATSCVATGYLEIGSGGGAVGVAVPVNADGTPAGPAVQVTATSQLARVACPTASTCVTVGNSPDVDPDPDVTTPGGVVVTITDGDIATADVQPVAGTFILFGVDCGAATSCTAAGATFDGTVLGQAMVVPITVTAGTVDVGPAQVLTAGTDASELLGVGCWSSTECTSVGLGADDLEAPVAIGVSASNDGSMVQVPGTTLLYEVDCPAPGSCLAVGIKSDGTPSLDGVGVVVPITDGAPGPAHMVGTDAVLVGVDCPTVTLCIAVGGETDDNIVSTGLVFTINPQGVATALGVDVTGSQDSGSSTPTFTATPTSSPAGVAVNGTVTCTTVDGGVAISPGLAVGNHTLDAASCSGLSLGGPNAGNYDLALNGGTFTVDQTQVATSTVVTSSANPSTFGQAVTFTATVSPDPGAGTVTFTEGTTTLGTGTLSGGSASLTTSTLGVGSHTVTASYADTPAFGASSGSVTQTVNKANSTTAVTSAPNPSQFAQNVALTATVTATPGAGTPTGTVTFKDGTTTLGTGTLNGSGQTTLNVSSLSVAAHTITATYSGSATVNASTSANLTQTVNQAVTSVAAANGTGFLRRTYSATLTRVHDGAKLAGKPVVFTIAGTTICTATTNANGVASCTVTAITIGGTYTASYAGDGNYLPSSGSANA